MAVQPGQEDLVPPSSQDALQTSLLQEQEALQAPLLKEQDDALMASARKERDDLQASLLKEQEALRTSFLKEQEALHAVVLKDEAARQTSCIKEQNDALMASAQKERDLQASVLKEQEALRIACLKEHDDALRASFLKEQEDLRASVPKEEEDLRASVLKEHNAMDAFSCKEQDEAKASMLKEQGDALKTALKQDNASLVDDTLQQEPSGGQLQALSGVQPQALCGVQQQTPSGVQPQALCGVQQQTPSGVQPQAPNGVQQQTPDEAQQQAPSATQIDLATLRGAASESRRDFKAETLRRVQQHEVSRLTSVWCDADPAWSLELLRSGGAMLEELGVCNPREEHLWAVHVMPRLRRLHLSVTDGALDALPPLLPALAQPSTLRWLALNGLPRATAQSLLQAHGAALDVLVLFLGAEPGEEWTRGCSDLDAFLGQCSLRLTQLVLWRWVDNHVPAVCAAQLEAARRAVTPSCSVRCSLCQRVPDRCFL